MLRHRDSLRYRSGQSCAYVHPAGLSSRLRERAAAPRVPHCDTTLALTVRRNVAQVHPPSRRSVARRWLLLSELYPTKCRGLAMSIGSTACWVFTTMVRGCATTRGSRASCCCCARAAPTSLLAPGPRAPAAGRVHLHAADELARLRGHVLPVRGRVPPRMGASSSCVRAVGRYCPRYAPPATPLSPHARRLYIPAVCRFGCTFSCRRRAASRWRRSRTCCATGASGSAPRHMFCVAAGRACCCEQVSMQRRGVAPRKNCDYRQERPSRD